MEWLDQLRGYIKANTPRATTPRVSPGKVIKEGLITPNEFNKPSADRFKETVLPMLGIPGAVAETADELYKGNPGMAALAATGAIPGAGVVGSIIKGGRKNLLLSHGSSVHGMLQALRSKERALEAPSMATSLLVNPYRSDVVLYPRPQKFDPATNPRSDLWGTDAFTYRRGQEQAMPNDPPPYARQKYRKDAKLTEYYTPEENSKLATVVSNPKFNSLAEYENSPTGAGRLSSKSVTDNDYYDYEQEINDRYYDWYQKTGSKYADEIGDPYRYMNRKDLMREFMVDNPDMMHKANLLPSEYGELKFHGKVPLDRENIAAVRFNAPNTDGYQELRREVQRRGLPIVPPHLKTQDEIASFVDFLTGLRNDYKPKLER